MKRLLHSTLIFLLIALVSVALPAYAQSEHESHHPEAEAAESPTSSDDAGMMGGMMSGETQGMMGKGGMMDMMHGQGGMMSGGMEDMMHKDRDIMCPMCRMMMQHLKGQSGMMSGGVQGMMGKGGMMGMMHGQGGMMSGGMQGMMKMQAAKKDAPLPMRLLEHADRLELSADQRSQLREIAVGLRKTTIQQQAARETAQVDLDVLLAQEDSNLATIEQTLNAIAQTEVAGRVAHLRASRKAKSLLTPEQLEKWMGKHTQEEDADAEQHEHDHSDE